jgi:hypothetical protein
LFNGWRSNNGRDEQERILGAAMGAAFGTGVVLYQQALIYRSTAQAIEFISGKPPVVPPSKVTNSTFKRKTNFNYLSISSGFHYYLHFHTSLSVNIIGVMSLESEESLSYWVFVIYIDRYRLIDCVGKRAPKCFIAKSRRPLAEVRGLTGSAIMNIGF